MTDNAGTPPQTEELLWRKNGLRTNYTFYNVGIGTNTANKPLHILGKIDSLPTIRLTHRYIVPSINQEVPLEPLSSKDIGKEVGDTIYHNNDIVGANGGLFFKIDNSWDFGFTHSTMQSAVKFLCNKSIITRENIYVYDKVSIGNGYSDIPIPAQLYVEGSTKLLGHVEIGNANHPGATLSVTGSISVGDNVKIYADGKMWVKNTIKVNVNKPNGWGDFVFDANYKLKSLQEVEMYVNEHKHLEGVPDAKTIDAEGIDLGAMTNILTQKMEGNDALYDRTK